MPSWPPLPVQIIAGAISGSRLALVSRSSLLLLAVLPGRSSAPLYLNNKSRGSPGHTLRARHYCLLNNGPARCLLRLGEEHASQLEQLQIIFQESPDSAGGSPESLSSSPFGSPQTFLGCLEQKHLRQEELLEPSPPWARGEGRILHILGAGLRNASESLKSVPGRG